MILVTGANGKLCRAIVKSLLSFVSAERITASVRSPDKAGELDALGVRVVQADYAQSDSLRRAFVGAEQVLMISSNAAAQGGDLLAQPKRRWILMTSRSLLRTSPGIPFAASASPTQTWRRD